MSKQNKLLFIVGLCIWGSIWIFSYTSLAARVMNDPKNIVLSTITLVVMLIGIVLCFTGIIRELIKK